MKVLIISADVNSELTVNMAPETASTVKSLNAATTRIYYLQDHIETFMAAMAQSVQYSASTSISSLNQRVTSFDDFSTYLPVRATLKEFDADILQSATIFTYVACRTIKDMGLQIDQHQNSPRVSCKHLQFPLSRNHTIHKETARGIASCVQNGVP